MQWWVLLYKKLLKNNLQHFILLLYLTPYCQDQSDLVWTLSVKHVQFFFCFTLSFFERDVKVYCKNNNNNNKKISRQRLFFSESNIQKLTKSSSSPSNLTILVGTCDKAACWASLFYFWLHTLTKIMRFDSSWVSWAVAIAISIILLLCYSLLLRSWWETF